jgi:hypothetical protein
VIVCRPSVFPSGFLWLGEFIQIKATDNKPFSSFQAQSEKSDRQTGDFFGEASDGGYPPTAFEHDPRGARALLSSRVPGCLVAPCFLN